MNTYRLFSTTAKTCPDRPAIVGPNGSISYGELRRTVEQTAAQMKARGIGPGDRVLVFVPMGIDLYRTVLAIFQVGAVAVFLDEWAGMKRVETCCRAARCKGFVGSWKIKLAAWLLPSVRKIPIKLSLSGYGRFAPDHEVFAAPESHPALITFTTGSTGTPKAALRSHGFLKKQFDVLSEELDPKPGSVEMTVLPIVLLINLGFGATSVIADFKASKPQSLSPEHIARQVGQWQVSRVIASPYFVRRLAEHCIERGHALGSVSSIFTGGAPVFPHEAQIFAKAFPQARVMIAYGSTEAEPISVIAAEEVAAAQGSAFEPLPVGRVNPHAQVKVIPFVDRPLCWAEVAAAGECPPGEVGEIIVAGPHVLGSYFDNEDAFRRNKIIADDGTLWHRTGDSGLLRPDGHLFLTGRCNTLFWHHGQLICPFLFESWLMRQKGVRMGTVMQREGKIVFFVEGEANFSKENVKSAIESIHLPDCSVIFLKEMPRDPRHHSKIDYARLQAL